MPEGWGGKRTPGPGKRLGPPFKPAGPLRSLSIRLTPEQIERLRELGGGNTSAGVRRLLERLDRATALLRQAERDFGQDVLDGISVFLVETGEQNRQTPAHEK